MIEKSNDGLVRTAYYQPFNELRKAARAVNYGTLPGALESVVEPCTMGNFKGTLGQNS